MGIGGLIEAGAAGYSGEWKKAIVSLKPSSKTIAFFDSMN